MSASLQIVCPSCHATNRVPAERLGDAPVCGACKQTLLNGQPLELGVDTFSRHLNNSDIPLLVDFWAPWCGPCQMMAPLFADAASQAPQVRFAKVNTQVETTIGQQFGIRSIPTLVLFRQGQEIARQAGVMDANSILGWLDQHARAA